MDELIEKIESKGLQWDVSNTGMNRGARVWKWPYVVGRYRANERESAREMLLKAYQDAVEREFKGYR